jgi:two-component system, response regulator YesN
MKIMIIDDELYIRKDLHNLLEEFDYDLDVVDFENPLPALNYLKSTRVDIIISDVRMPDMNGLEFFEIIYKKYPSIYLIIVSGFSDFEYAQKAITFGVKAFILKPVDEKIFDIELFKALNVVKENAPIKIKKNSNNQLLNNIEIEKKIYSFLFRDSDKIGNMITEDPLLGVKGVHSLCMVNTDVKLTSIMLDKIRLIIESFLKKINYYLITSKNRQNYILVFHCERCSLQKNEALYVWILKLMNNLISLSKSEFNANCFISISEIRSTQKGIEENYAQAESIMRMRFYSDNPSVLQVKDFNTSIFNDKTLTHQKMILLENLLVKRCWECVSHEIYEIFQHVSTSGFKSTYDIISIGRLCSNVLIKMIWRNDFQLKDDSDKVIKRLSNINNYFSLVHLKDDILYLLDSVSEAANLKINRDDIVEDLIKFLHKNYDLDISFSDLAEIRYKISVEHLNRKFKKKLGNNISIYLKELRMKKAGELLGDSSLSITNIAGMVGYNDISHFIHTFKIIYEETPGEFRKHKLLKPVYQK